MSDEMRVVDGVVVSSPQWGDCRTVRFMPTRIDNLRPEALPLVGQVIEVEFAGTVDEGYPYEGQAIWTPVSPEVRTGWIPDEDLADTI